MIEKYKKENANDVVFNLEYNSEREHLIIPEYGRHLQKLIEQATISKMMKNATKRQNTSFR